MDLRDTDLEIMTEYMIEKLFEFDDPMRRISLKEDIVDVIKEYHREEGVE